VRLEAVCFNDEAVRRPGEVDLVGLVVEGGEGGVDLRLWQARVAHQLQEASLEHAAGQLGLVGGRSLQDRLSSVPVRGRQEVGSLGRRGAVGARPARRARSRRSARTVAARSSSVLGTVVIGMPGCVVMSWASRERVRCRRISSAPRRVAGAVTSMRVWSLCSRPARTRCATAPRPKPKARSCANDTTPHCRRASSASLTSGGVLQSASMSCGLQHTPRAWQATCDTGPRKRNESAQPRSPRCPGRGA
jgi:hypothetical protein